MSEVHIRNIVYGDSARIIRDVTDIPEGETAARAWLTIKRQRGNADAAAVLQKSITDTNVEDQGFILPSQASPPISTEAVLEFHILPADWDGIDPDVLYFYDVQVLTSGGGVYTVETGTFLATPDITRAIT